MGPNSKIGNFLPFCWNLHQRYLFAFENEFCSRIWENHIFWGTQWGKIPSNGTKFQNWQFSSVFDEIRTRGTFLHLKMSFAVGFGKIAFFWGGHSGVKSPQMGPNSKIGNFCPFFMKFSPELDFCIWKWVLRSDLGKLHFLGGHSGV